MKKLRFKNWKTTLAGIAIIVVKLLAVRGRINPADAPIILTGIGLIAAKDHNAGNNE